MASNFHFATIEKTVDRYEGDIFIFEADCKIECDYITDDDGAVLEVQNVRFVFETMKQVWDDTAQKWVGKITASTTICKGLLYDLLLDSLKMKDLEEKVQEYHDERGGWVDTNAEHAAHYRASVL
jgi:hypothetical protein